MADKCKHCGASVIETAKFCSECGAKIERELKCVNCGTLLAENAKFCMECGTPIKKVEIKDESGKVKCNEPKAIKETKPLVAFEEIENEHLDSFLTNLRNVLEEAIELQLTRKGKTSKLQIMTDTYSMFGDFDEEFEVINDFWNSKEYEIIGNSIQTISNCCFWADNGEEVFDGTMNDGNPHLTIDLCFSENEIYHQRMISSSVYSKFSHLKCEYKSNPTIHHFYIDCGENVDDMVDICEALVKEIYNEPLTQEWQFMAEIGDSKKTAQKEAIEAIDYQYNVLGWKLQSAIHIK